MPWCDPWPWHVKVFEQVVEALPRETAALTPPAQHLDECFLIEIAEGKHDTLPISTSFQSVSRLLGNNTHSKVSR